MRDCSYTKPRPVYQEYEYTPGQWLKEQRLRLAQSLSFAHPLWSRINEETGALDAPLAGTTYTQSSINLSNFRAANDQALELEGKLGVEDEYQIKADMGKRSWEVSRNLASSITRTHVSQHWSKSLKQNFEVHLVQKRVDSEGRAVDMFSQ